MSAVGKILERIGELESDLAKALRLVRRMAGIGEQGNLAEDARAYLAARQAPAPSPGQPTHEQLHVGGCTGAGNGECDCPRFQASPQPDRGPCPIAHVRPLGGGPCIGCGAP